MRDRILIATVLTVAMASPVLAQSDEQIRAKKLALEMEMQSMMTMHAEGVVESRIVAGQPYSAEATTEFVQVLGDGNRISRKNTVRIYRDSEGRTRREELGSGDTVQSVSIYDPVAHVSYVLDPNTRIAHKSAVKVLVTEPGWAVAFGAAPHTLALKKHAELAAVQGDITLVAPETAVTPDLDVQKAEKMKAEAGVRVDEGRGTLRAVVKNNPLEKSSSESLGRQTIGGVDADGVRTTTILAAGAIGNEQEIRIISEEWRSPDLQVLVLTKHNDPRSGETTYRLSNIVRAEPGAGLFEVPADYTIRDSSYMKMPAFQ
jgi:hypothetical protein